MNGILFDLEEETFGSRAEESLRQENHIVFLFHGFNVSEKEGFVSLTGLASHMLLNEDLALVCVLWPGDSWADFFSYPFEGKKADDTGYKLARFINRAVTPGTRLSFVTHSLGTRAALETLQNLPENQFILGRACLMAAAVNNFCLAAGERYDIENLDLEGIAVLSSKEDEVLRFAYPAGNLLHKFLHWDRDAGLALGYTGPKKTKSSKIHEADTVADHSDYLPAFKLGQGPSSKRAERQKAAAGFADQYIAGKTPD